MVGRGSMVLVAQRERERDSRMAHRFQWEACKGPMELIKVDLGTALQ